MDGNVIAATQSRFTTDPAAARATPAVTAKLVDGHAELSAGSFTWAADLAPALGGGGTAPSPTAYLLGALAGCAVAFIHDTLGPQLGVRIDDVTAVARCTTDSRGLLGMDGAAPDLADIALEIMVDSPDPADTVRALYEVWLERCPIYLATLKANPIDARLAVAGVPTPV